MCGRFAQKGPPKKLAQVFGVEEAPAGRPY
jgi:hypothetical protein